MNSTEPNARTTARVIFLHGLESGPWGTKSVGLRDVGFDVTAPDGCGLALAARVDVAMQAVSELPMGQTILVGSSYGGAVALVVANRLADAGRAPAGLVLCAPALYLPEPPLDGDPPSAPVDTVVVHGVDDAIVPPGWSRRWSEGQRRVRLVEVDDGHRLVDSLDAIVGAVRGFASASASAPP